MNKRWLWITVGVVILVSFLLSDSMWRTFANKKSMVDKAQELSRLDQEATKLESTIQALQTHPDTYEQLVRKELNYLRPGEKEIRFVKK